MQADDTFLATCTRGRGTNQAITQGVELHQVHDLIHKGSDDLSGFPSGPQLGAEQQSLPDCGLGRVHIKLLHVATDTSECGLLFRVAVHADVTLDYTACSYQSINQFTFCVFRSHQRSQQTMPTELNENAEFE